MERLTYALCALAALLCTVLLLRAWLRARTRLLLWGGLCFAGLTVNNVLLVLDRLVFVDFDLSLWRQLSALLSVSLLVAGLVLEGDR
jgi:hypothetical protein